VWPSSILAVKCTRVVTRFYHGTATHKSSTVIKLPQLLTQLHSANFYMRLASREDRAALIFFSSPGCGSCHAFRSLLPTLQDTSVFSEKPAEILLDVYEVDAGDSMGLVREHEVPIPWPLFFNSLLLLPLPPFYLTLFYFCSLISLSLSPLSHAPSPPVVRCLTSPPCSYTTGVSTMLPFKRWPQENPF
jgi:hypothetical protein